jgi:hypothetical protein
LLLNPISPTLELGDHNTQKMATPTPQQIVRMSMINEARQPLELPWKT